MAALPRRQLPLMFGSLLLWCLPISARGALRLDDEGPTEAGEARTNYVTATGPHNTDRYRDVHSAPQTPDDAQVYRGHVTDWHFHQDNHFGDNHGDGERLNAEVPNDHDSDHHADDTVIYNGQTVDRFYHEHNHHDDAESDGHANRRHRASTDAARGYQGADFDYNSAARNSGGLNGESGEPPFSPAGESVTAFHGITRDHRNYRTGPVRGSPVPGDVHPSGRSYYDNDADDDGNRAKMDGNRRHGDANKEIPDGHLRVNNAVADNSLAEDELHSAPAHRSAAGTGSHQKAQRLQQKVALAQSAVDMHMAQIEADRQALQQLREAHRVAQARSLDQQNLQESRWHSEDHHPHHEHIHGHVTPEHNHHHGDPPDEPDNKIYVVHNGGGRHDGHGVVQMLHHLIP